MEAIIFDFLLMSVCIIICGFEVYWKKYGWAVFWGLLSFFWINYYFVDLLKLNN